MNLNDFLTRKAELEARANAVASWHIQAYVEGGVPLPWTPAEAYMNVNVYDENSGEVDREASLEVLANIAAYCTKQGVAVMKEYDYDFTLRIELEVAGQRPVTIEYSADREAVCVKKVVGTKVVPAKTTPERTEEIVEWECEPVSLLARSKTKKAKAKS